MANDGKFLNLESGKKKLDQAINASAGAGDASKIVRTDGTGRLDSSLLPVGVGADTLSIEASETLAAGDFVNIFDDSSTPKIRKADATNGRDADGFVLAGVTSGANGDVYFEGTNTQLSGMTIGARQYLGATGAVTETPNTTATQLHQFLGKASSATELNIEITDQVVLG